MSRPYFSICLPSYNGIKTITRAVESVCGQTFRDWHLTIIDDFSTDGTWELLLREYASHPQITIIQNRKNLGLRQNLNRCLESAEGYWLGILGQDDTYRLHALETIHEQLNPRNDVVLWAHGEFAHAGGRIPNAVPIFTHVQEFLADNLADILYRRGNIFGVISSYFLSMERIRESKLSFIDGTMFVDLRFYLRLLKHFPNHKAIYWPDLLCSVNTDETTASHRLTKLGYAQLDLISSMGDLAVLGWKRSTLLYQLIRLLRCSLRFRPALLSIPGGKAASWEAARSLISKLWNPKCDVIVDATVKPCK